MGEQVVRATNSLFPENGDRVVNVKFFLGNNRGVTAEQLADQLLRADSQIENGLARPTPLDSELTVTNV